MIIALTDIGLIDILLTAKCIDLSLLSNDPGKKGSNLFCCGTIRFPHIQKVFIFTQRMHKSTKRQFTKENVFEIHF